MAPLARYTLSFYVPHSALQACKDALFAAGAGTYPRQVLARVLRDGRDGRDGPVPTERGRGAEHRRRRPGGEGWRRR
jgi:hypothetical protein